MINAYRVRLTYEAAQLWPHQATWKGTRDQIHSGHTFTRVRWDNGEIEDIQDHLLEPIPLNRETE